LRESKLYPIVERFLQRNFHCFRTAKNKGLRYSRIDVLGVRDVGGDLSGDIETIGVEVKKGSQPFAQACGQTAGYKVYANRVYLAELRGEPYGSDELKIASDLGIGLIQIKQDRCYEVLSSPFYQPTVKFNLSLLERLALGKCQICESFFEIGDLEKNFYSKMARENLQRAIKNEKGLIFWNDEVAERKNKARIRILPKNIRSYERRFICPDCVYYLLSQFQIRSKE
jgi:hypothetical protein